MSSASTRSKLSVLAISMLSIAVLTGSCASDGTGSDQGASGREREPNFEGTARRFFAEDASWNRPVSELGISTEFAPYAKRLWNYGGHPAAPGTVKMHFGDYSVPIWDAAEATGEAKIFQTTWAQAQAKISQTGLKIGDSIPWNPDWKPGPGNDRAMVVVNYATGQTWEFWGVGEIGVNCLDVLGPNQRAGYDIANNRHICIAAINSYDNLFTATDGELIRGRGAGVNKVAFVTRAEEVLSGSIDHAMEMSISATMYGAPECPDGAASPGAGTTCGFYLPPATRVEFTDKQSVEQRCGEASPPFSDAERAKTVPEGMRFAITITDDEIDAWLDSRDYVGAKRQTARIFAVAMRDYGVIITETSCHGLSLQTDGLVNPTTAELWAKAGITKNGSRNPSGDLLTGLITEERLVVVNPPGA